MDERARRLVAASEAMVLPRGGVSLVHRSCGLSRTTLTTGIRELRFGETLPAGRVRRDGGGRKSIEEKYPDFGAELDRLFVPYTRGDPESPLRWTRKSTRALATELGRRRLPVCHEKVAQALRTADYSLRGNRKTEEGASHGRVIY